MNEYRVESLVHEGPLMTWPFVRKGYDQLKTLVDADDLERILKKIMSD